jgi:Integrase core domain
VDDRSRVAFSQVLDDETAKTCARFLVEAAGFFAEHGVRIERVLTDNAKAYTESVLFAETAGGWGSGSSAPAATGPRPMGRSSGSTRPCSMSGPTRGCTAATPNVAAPWPGGCGSTITDDHTPRSTA